MHKLSFIFACLFMAFSYGQSPEQNKASDLYQSAPDWAKLMYTENPNVNQVDQLYAAYYRVHAYVKTYHTQYYKRWRSAISSYLNNDGYIDTLQKTNLSLVIDQLRNGQSTNQNKQIGNWSPLGPFRNFKTGGTISSGAQANIFSIGRCEAVPNIMYCGTEPGEVYKSMDSGNTWVNVSKSLIPEATTVLGINFGVFALAVHPTNPDIVYIGAGRRVHKTVDGGLNWTVIFTSNVTFTFGGNPAELHINTNNPQIVMLAGQEGIYRSTNGGTNWTQVLTNACFDIKAKPGNPNTLYTIRTNTATNTHQFLRSTNGGLTWTPQSTGWYSSINAARTVRGARIAVTPADTNKIYAHLIGDSKSGDNGFIGVYASNNGGNSWANTMGYDGAPYTASHPNLAAADFDPTFNQGFYNCAIMASNTNANEFLVGGIGMWRSNDGGISFQCIYNYGCGNYNPMHVDMQDFRVFGNEYWATTDGGIFKSNDLFNSQPQFKMEGINATNFWGFGSGWNRDILVGGTFHNGVQAFAEGFPNGSFLSLSGGEPASGYVNPGNQTSKARIYSKDMGSKILPQTITGTVLSLPYQETINEFWVYAESSEMEFHPSCYNHVYQGHQNNLLKSTDGGANFSSVYTASANTQILGIEISRSNPNTMYIVVKPTPPSANSAYIVKTTNDWLSNTNITALPSGGNNLISISLDPENDQIIWLAYPRGANGNKIFKSIDGGTTWTNLTTSMLDAQSIQAIQTIGGTNGGVYIATNLSVYYRNNNMSNWVLDNANLPAVISTKGIRPFYRDGKIRLASYGKGIWESPLYEAPTRPVAKIMVDKLSSELNCNQFNFDDYSMLNHTNATWDWTFQNANITSASIRNPQVSFNTLGNHMVTLTVTDANQVSSSDTLFISITNLTSTSINQNFEVALLPQYWFLESSGNLTWSQNDTVGGYGQSSKCMSVDNFNISQLGLSTDIVAPINMSAISLVNAKLKFDVAYALFAPNYADTLQVLVSTNCGASYTTVYNKGGATLGTAPSMQTPFVPIASQWRTDSVDLSSYTGNPFVFIKFRNINQNGQFLYIDNIKLQGNASAIQYQVQSNKISVYPNPVSNKGFINVKAENNDEIQFYLFNLEGKLIDKIFTNYNTQIPINQYGLIEGAYYYKIISKDKIHNGKLFVSSNRK